MTLSKDWWHNLIVYQVYPKSFQDSNDDGFGDIPGLISRLDYIRDLGANMIWLNPIFVSPQIDNGYDVADYLQIDPIFGTMEDVEILIEEAHKRDIKVTFDFVMNHTSDQHPWFQEAIKGPDNPYRDYYLFEDPKEDGSAPNNWEGFFTGSVWEKEPNGDQYYFHLFAKEMPDLNWHNPKVMEEMLGVAKFWAAKGIDGFRIDAFIHMIKEPGFPDLDYLEPGEIDLAEHFYANLPGVNEIMKEFAERLRAEYPDVFIVGEAASATVDLARDYADPAIGGTDSVITFRYFTEDTSHKDPRLSGNMQKAKLDIPAFKANMAQWQSVMEPFGGPTLYWNNHDMARAVSRFGDDARWRDNSAKMLATLMYLQKGIPFILNGEELGMKNLQFETIDDFSSPEARTFYEEALELGYTEKSIIANIAGTSKDASRGVMQWNDDAFAGFSTHKPWSGVNSESYYNAEEEEINPYSVLNFYRNVLALKKQEIFTKGSFQLWQTNEDYYVYSREWYGDTAVVICNLTNSSREYVLPAQGVGQHRYTLLENEGNYVNHQQLLLAPYGTAVYLYSYNNELPTMYPITD